VPAALLIVVALWEACATVRDSRSVPDDDAWARAEKIVRADYKPGDLIVFAPDWVDPVGRLHLGDLISVEAAGRMDDAKYARIWELSIRGAHAIDGTPAYEHSDEVTVRRFEQTPVKVVTDLRDHAPETRLQRVLAEVGFEPHDCLVITAPARVTFPKLQLGTTLVGYMGIPDVFERREYREPGTLQVEIGGANVAVATAGVDDGWVRFEAKTQPGVADVTVIASATAGPGQHRKICFAAEARE